MFGYAGKILKIDLTKKSSETYPWEEANYEKYLGGKVMAAKILTDLKAYENDPLSEENIVVISTGPFTNTGGPASSRFNVSTVSPLTGYLTSSNCGGNFGIMLKKAGYDALIITGKSKEQTVIEITDDLRFLDGRPYWGMTVSEVQEALPKRHGKLVIGPAGEHQVKYAGLFSQERAAGRGGIGAVFGYKNLKGISVFGQEKTETYKLVKPYYKKWIQTLREHPITGDRLPKYGTAGMLRTMQNKKILATRNFKNNQFASYDSVSGETLKETRLIRNKGCVTCPIQCGRQVKYKGQTHKGPELETLGLLGPNIMNHDLDKIIKWNVELDDYGLDSISTAGVLAFAMEATEKGYMKTELAFGKNENISEYLRKIAYREDIGDELAEGVQYLSLKYGGQDFAMHSKGMELSAYEPRNAYGQGLGYAVSNRGGCHLNAGYIVLFEAISMQMDPKSLNNKAELTIFSQDLLEVTSAAGTCLFTLQAMLPKSVLASTNSGLARFADNLLTTRLAAGTVQLLNRLKGNQLPIHLPNIPHTKALELVTGFKMNLGIYKTIGERGYTLERLFNLKRGLKPEEDRLPKRLVEDGVPIHKLRSIYYKKRGWDERGYPKEKTLKKLHL